jgi:prepilin-type N-terminal cleavage/methylation domain-containing protein/prepilin-type processing-associated H-X9-DG protein
MDRNRHSFTLIELLVVVAIIAILSALLLPALQNAKLQAKRAACQSNLHQLGIAVTSYAGDFSDWLPTMNTSWPWYPSWAWIYDAFTDATATSFRGQGLVYLYYGGYLKSKNVFYCPGYWDNCGDGFGWRAPEIGWPLTVGGVPSGPPWQWRSGYMWLRGADSNFVGSCDGVLGDCAVKLNEVVRWDGQHFPANSAKTVALTCLEFGYRVGGSGSFTCDQCMYSHANSGNPRGANAWFLDGHVEWLPESMMQDSSGGSPGYFHLYPPNQ